MNTWNEVVNAQILNHIDAVKKTTQPLLDIFGIDYFTYHRIDKEGRYTVLLDRPDWAEHYVTQKLYKQDPYLQHADAYTSGFCLVDMYGSIAYKELILIEGSKFNLDFGITLIQKNDKDVEFFGFAGSKDNSALNKLYLNHQPLLISFASHFKEQHSATLQHLSDGAPSLEILKGKKLEKRPMQMQLGEESHHSFLKALGMHQQIKQAYLLSHREKLCLQWLIKGKSSKETASRMGISPRTVESYFENIKNKLSCWSKNEIFDIAKNLSFLGLLP
ncbi:MAG: autoinducer binding domain-containing protein [Parachlamydiaceae bacterium]|nr:autoinducer binding domain-containing protein [Parachlamydiaceae bacterium]